MRDARGDGWGLLLSWRDRDGRLHRWVMPHRALIAEAATVEAELVDRGLSIAPGHAERTKLRAALVGVRSEIRIRSVSRAGWHHGSGGVVYVLPDGEVIGQATDRVILQVGTNDTLDVPATAGDLEDWKAEVGAHAVGNHYLALFLAAAFTGPLLDLTGDKSGGFHLFGRSQSGKTTLLRCAASVWGPPDMGAMLRSWRATANGLEATAAEASDGLLPLDEIGQADGREVAEVVYMLGNESGKQRSNRATSARRSKTWRLIFLSTGEVDLGAKLTEAGKRIMAGQDVRMASLPLPPAGPVAGSLQGRSSPQALLVHLNEAVRRHYGTAARAFLATLARARTEDAAGLVAGVEDTRRRFLAAHLLGEADGQVISVARRFALVAAAGEIAAGFGVLPWPEGEAERAAGACFQAWLTRRGGTDAAEDEQTVERVRHFIALHGASRFATLIPAAGGEEEGYPDRLVVNRAGWRRKDAAGRWEYLILPEVWAKEVCAGANSSEMARALKGRGLLIPEALRPLSLLIDESDTFLGDNEELRGILNSGFEASGEVVRVVEVQEEWRPIRFATFCPVALAGIGSLPGTLEDRAVPIVLQRKAAAETVVKLRAPGARAALHDLARKLARWAADRRRYLPTDPAVPDAMGDREGDIAVPLLAIADAAGGEWPARARRALLDVYGVRTAKQGAMEAGALLLADIKALFIGLSATQLASARIVEHLATLEERPWPEWRQGKPMTAPQLARALAPFGVRPGTIRTGNSTPKGYYREAFEEAWTRYLPPETPVSTPQGGSEPQHRHKSGKSRLSGEIASATPEGVLRIENRAKAAENLGCGGVAVSAPPLVLQLSLQTGVPRCGLACTAVEAGHVGGLRERPGVAWGTGRLGGTARRVVCPG